MDIKWTVIAVRPVTYVKNFHTLGLRDVGTENGGVENVGVEKSAR